MATALGRLGKGRGGAGEGRGAMGRWGVGGGRENKRTKDIFVYEGNEIRNSTIFFYIRPERERINELVNSLRGERENE